ncbi:hypothetical protein ABI59_18600 [Acidobacteria bacterium Mor1]|nr:hypothetical protein ABI59_18600 [Acidobacteria bacterium Mor1]
MLFSLLILLSLAPAAEAKEPLRADELDDALARAESLWKYVQGYGLLEGELQSLPTPGAREETHDLGFGASRLSYVWSEGYGYHQLDLLVYRDRLAEFHVLYWAPYSWDQISYDLLGAWVRATDEAFEERAAGLLFERRFEPVAREYEAELAGRLGASARARVPRRLRADYAWAEHPLSDVSVGPACGDGQPLSREYRLIERLVKQRRVDLLANLLRGRNPETRVMALLGLRSLARSGVALDSKLLSTMERVRTSDLQVDFCEGCIADRKTAGEAIQRYEAIIKYWRQH